MANGADVNAISNQNTTTFAISCRWRSLSFLQQELADKVTPDHLSMPNSNGDSPMNSAFQHNPDYLPIVRMLILRGVTARPQDFPVSDTFFRSLRPRRRDLLASLEADLRLNDQILIGLFLAGIHAPTTTTTFTTTTITATTNRVRTQQPDGGWNAPVSVPCEPHVVLTAVATDDPVAARVVNHLPKLRGHQNLWARMAIAGFMGVRPATELGRLRAVRDVVAAVEEE